MSAIQNKKQPFSRTSFWKTAVVGFSDGLIISLALITVMHSLTTNIAGIITTTCYAAFFGALLVGIAGYFSAKFRMESLRLKTPEEEKMLNEAETEKTIALFQRLNLSTEMQEQAANEIEKDSREWKALIEKNDQPFEIPDKKQLPLTGFMIGLSYLTGALFPLMAFIIFDDKANVFKYCLFFSLAALYISGYIKSYINKEPLLWGSVRLLLLGAAAAACAWLLASVFIMMTP